MTGDFQVSEGSDLDLAVVLEHVDFSTRRAVFELAYDELLENDVDISPVGSFERQKAAHFPLLREIEWDMASL